MVFASCKQALLLLAVPSNDSIHRYLAQHRLIKSEYPYSCMSWKSQYLASIDTNIQFVMSANVIVIALQVAHLLVPSLNSLMLFHPFPSSSQWLRAAYRISQIPF